MSTITLEELKEKEARWSKITEFWREKYSNLEDKLTEKLSVAEDVLSQNEAIPSTTTTVILFE